MSRISLPKCFSVFVLTVVAFTMPCFALGGMYQFDKIFDTTEFASRAARAVPFIGESGVVTYRGEAVTMVYPGYKDLNEFGIPLDDSGPYKFFGTPFFNSGGEAVVTGRHADNGDTILFWSDNEISMVVDQSGVFQRVSSHLSINNHGDVLFNASLDESPNDTMTLYIWKDGVIDSIVGAGELLDGNTVVRFDGMGRNGQLNDAGQVVFNALFSDGSRAIYRATPIPVPEPATLVTLLVGAILLVLFARRRRDRCALNFH